MADNNFKGTVEALFTGIDGVVSSKTVVGDAIHIGDTFFHWWMYLLQLEPERLMRTRRKKEPEVLAAR